MEPPFLISHFRPSPQPQPLLKRFSKKTNKQIQFLNVLIQHGQQKRTWDLILTTTVTRRLHVKIKVTDPTTTKSENPIRLIAKTSQSSIYNIYLIALLSFFSISLTFAASEGFVTTFSFFTFIVRLASTRGLSIDNGQKY